MFTSVHMNPHAHEGAESPKIKQQSKYKKCDDGVNAVVLQSVMHVLKVARAVASCAQTTYGKGHTLPVGAAACLH